jgi:hypothetical protein
MKRTSLSTIVLSSALISMATMYSTDLPARDKSSQGASVSAGGVSVSADRGGASVSSGDASVSADRGSASVSSGDASVSADRDGASVSAGNASVSADRGGASVSSGTASVSAERGDADVGSDGDRKAPAVQPAERRPVGDKSYGSLGEWFDDLRSSLFGERTKGSDEMRSTTTHSSTTRVTETSDDGRTQVNRVTQTEIATGGGSASAEASNVNETEQKH